MIAACGFPETEGIAVGEGNGHCTTREARSVRKQTISGDQVQGAASWDPLEYREVLKSARKKGIEQAFSARGTE